MSDFENEKVHTPTDEAPPEEASGIRDISPEYVSDLLSRLRETMAVIREEEQAAADATEDELPPWEAPAAEEESATEEESAAEEESATEEESAAEEEPAAEEVSAVEEVPTAEETPAVEETPVVEEAPAIEETPIVEEAPAAEEAPAPEEAPAVEELTLDSMIDALIAENRERKKNGPGPEPQPSRAAAVTESILAAAVETPPPPPEAPSAPAAGIFEMASVASETVAAEKKVRRRRFRVRLLYTAASRPDAVPPTVREVGESSPLFAEEATPVAEEGVGTLRPQDFFIADLREEELTAGETKEYVSRNQIETILGSYAERKRETGVRFFLSLFLAAVVLLFENLPLLGVSVPSLFGISPRVYVLLDIALLVAALLLATDVLREGVREVFAWEFGTAAVVLISSVVSLLLLLINLLLGATETAHLSALPAVLCVVLSLGFGKMHARDEEKTFLHLCESGDKLAAEILPAAYATEESSALGRRVRSVLRVKKVGFVSGYFSRMRKKREDYRLHTVLILSSLGTLLLGTALYALIASSASGAAVLSFASWLSVPLSLSVFFAARRLPFHHLVEAADARGTAVLGEAAAEEYASVDSVAFEDVEAYPSRNVRVRRIKMYDNSRLDELLYYMASIFSVLGGPLDGIFRVSASELGLSDSVAVLTTAEDGLLATVDGVPIRVGKWGYFPIEQVEPYYDSEDNYKEEAGNISIVYVTVRESVAAKLYIEYTLSRRFEENVRRLRREGVETLVRSFDPSIRDSLLETSVRFPGLRIRGVRKKPAQICDFAEARVDSGLVTGAGSRDLINTLFLCCNYRRVIRIGRLLKLLAVPLSLLTSVLLGLLPGGSPFFSVYGAAIGLFWLLPVYALSRLYFRKER